MKIGWENFPGIKTLKKWRKTKKITEPIVSDTSLSQDQDTPQESSKPSLQNPLISYNNRFNGDQMMKILFWIATFTPYKEIVKLVKEEFNIPISTSAIKQYAHKNEDYRNTILKIREKWANDLSEIQLAHKRKRVEAISGIYEKCLETNQMKNALGAIYQIQGEVEKAQSIGTQTNYQINIFKDMSEEELEQEKVKSLERLKILKQIPEITAEEVPNAGEK